MLRVQTRMSSRDPGRRIRSFGAFADGSAAGAVRTAAVGAAVGVGVAAGT
jgi:hypothetical protein